MHSTISVLLPSVIILCGIVYRHQIVVEGAPVSANKLLLILVDGFRWDYFKKFGKDELPGFNKLRESGVSAEGFVPVFPSLSFVNYYAIMTGTYAENNGMIDNYMYDTKYKQEFLIGDNPEQYNSFWWNDGEPLWIAAVRQGKRSYFWYWNGCEVEIRGYRPTYCSPYQSTPDPSFENFTIALDLAVQVLRNNSADVAGVYLERVDAVGHKYGPNSDEVRNTILELDKKMLHILQVIEQQSTPGINLMVFSDHGMAERIGGAANDTFGQINIADYVNTSDWDYAYSSRMGPVLQIWPKDGKLNSMYETLRKAHPNLTAYLKQDIPDRYHFKGHYRVPPLYLVVDKGYAIARNKSTRQLNYVGYHGYDNTVYEDMRGIFFVKGPDFRRNITFKQRFLPNVNAYQLMCHVLKLQPQPHNGTWSNVCDALVSDSSCSDGPYVGGAHKMAKQYPGYVLMLVALITWACAGRIDI